MSITYLKFKIIEVYEYLRIYVLEYDKFKFRNLKEYNLYLSST